MCQICSNEDAISIANYRNTGQLVNVSVSIMSVPYSQRLLGTGLWLHKAGLIFHCRKGECILWRITGCLSVLGDLGEESGKQGPALGWVLTGGSWSYDQVS